MKKHVLMAAALILAATITAGCTGGGNKPASTPAADTGNKQESTQTQQTAEADSDASADVASADEQTSSPTKLKFWIPWDSQYIQSVSDNEGWQTAARVANVEIEFISPSPGQETEAYNLLLASGDYPDLMKHREYKGGGLKAVKDGVYLKLNDYLDTNLPNYKATLGLSDAIAKQAREDDGTIWSFKMIQPHEEPAWAGPAIRKDYLDKVGLDVPVTIDDWHTVLTAFKNELGVEAPMLMNWKDRVENSGAFMGAFDSAFKAFVNRDGKVEFGPTTEGFREWLTVMHQWYVEGLLDQNFATRDTKSEDAYISNGKAGSAAVIYYGEFGAYITAGKAADPDYDFTPVDYPVLNQSDKVEDLKIANKNWEVRGSDIVIAATSQNIDAALTLMDFWYSDEGFMVGNYGIEGVSYEWVDGAVEFEGGSSFFPPGLQDRIKTQHPQFTEFMTKNPDGIEFWELMDGYKLSNDAYLRNPMSYERDPMAYVAMELWSKPNKSYIMPPLSQTDEESQRFNDIMTPMKTYRDEMVYKFIMGDEPMSNFDAFVASMKSMGIDEAVQIQQTQLDRYNSR